MNQESYLDAMTQRLRADGNTVTQVQFEVGLATVAYQSKVSWRWLAAKPNLFTMVLPCPEETQTMFAAVGPMACPSV